jgi:NTE family protein
MKPLVLALGGGGMRGAAHFGALLALEKAGVPIAGIAGVSSGAIVAMMHALEPLEVRLAGESHRKVEVLGRRGYAELEYLFHPQAIKNSIPERLKALASWERVIRGAVFGAGLVNPEALRSSLIALVGGARFEDARLPLAFLAVDLIGAEPVVLRHGSMINAALASSAIPGVFPPVQLDGRLLVDGHVLENVPVSVARALIPDATVLAVDVGDESAALSPPKTALEVILRAAHISRDALRKQSVANADLVLSIGDVPGGAFEYGRGQAMFEAGFDRMLNLLPALLERLDQDSLITSS